MGADANIFLQGQQPVRSVSDYMGDMDLRDLRRAQLQGATQNNALQALTMDQTRQTMADTQRRQNALRMAVQASGPNADPNQFAKTLLQNPDTMDAGVALQTHLATIGKTQADTTESLAKAGKATQETAGSAYDLRVRKADQAFKDISAFDTPEQALESLNQHAAAGDVDFQKASAIAQQLQALPKGDRIAFQKWQTGMLQGILSAKEKLAELAPKPVEVRLGDRVAMIDMNPNSQTYKQEVSSARVGVSPDTAATNATNRANNRDTLAQGERLAANAVTYQTDGNGNLVAVPTKAPSGSVIKAQSVVAPGPGMTPLQGKDGGLNADQSKALSFGSRMSDARTVIDEMEKAGVFNKGGTKATAQTAGRILGLGTDSMGGTLADVAGNLTNFTQSTEQQRYEGAKQNWIAANLRKESGAAIAPSEYRDADNQYFPQPGDDKETRADKVRRRKIAEDTMLAEVPQQKRMIGSPNQLAKPSKPGGVVNWGDLK